MMNKRLLSALLALPFISFGQLSVTKTGQAFEITFDKTVSGVNNSVFTGSGFNTSPGTGQLDSDGWSFTGWSDPDMNFGGSATGGDAARGTSNGGTTIEGFYSYNTANGGASPNYAFGWRATSGEFDPGDVTLKLVNNTGDSITALRISYVGKEYNAQGNDSQIDVYYSEDDVIYSQVPKLSITTVKSAYGPSQIQWVSRNKTAVISNLKIGGGDNFYIRWHNEKASGASGYDDFAIDDIAITAYNIDYLWDGSVWSSPAGQPKGDQSLSTALVLGGNTANIDTTTNLQALVVEAGAKLNVASGYQLSIADTFLLPATGPSIYTQINGALLGVAQYQVFLNSDIPKWHNVAIPVQADFNDVTGVPLNITGNTNNTNVWYYDATVNNVNGEGQFKPMSAMTDATHDIGLQIFAGDSTYFGVGPFIMQTEGTLVDGTRTIAVSDANDSAFNILPNPYPSTLEWNALRGSNALLTSTYYIQDGTFDDNVYTYRTYNGTIGINGGSNDIPPGQSYFVKVTGTGNISFQNSMRNVTGNSTLYKVQSSYEYVKLQSKHLGTGLTDETVVGFGSALTDNFDTEFDGTKFMNQGYPNFYTRTSGKKYTYNGLDNDWQTRDVDLYFEGEKTGQYEISVTEDVLPAQWTVVLEDKLTNTFTNLRGGGYTYNHANGNTADRFVLHFNKTGAVSMPESDLAAIYTYVEKEQLNVRLGDLKDVTVTVYNVKGELITASKASASYSTDMTGWANGAYLVKVTKNGAQVYEEKIINH